jgi:hypothetical protein
MGMKKEQYKGGERERVCECEREIERKERMQVMYQGLHKYSLLRTSTTAFTLKTTASYDESYTYARTITYVYA